MRIYIKVWLRKCGKKKHPRNFTEFVINNNKAIVESHNKKYSGNLDRFMLGTIQTKITKKKSFYVVEFNISGCVFVLKDVDKFMWLWRPYQTASISYTGVLCYYGDAIIYTRIWYDIGFTTYNASGNIQTLLAYRRNKKILATQNTILKELEHTTTCS